MERSVSTAPRTARASTQHRATPTLVSANVQSAGRVSTATSRVHAAATDPTARWRAPVRTVRLATLPPAAVTVLPAGTARTAN